MACYALLERPLALRRCVEDMFGNQDGGEVEAEKCVLALGIEFSARFFRFFSLREPRTVF